jgi:hypothetical protein
MASNICNWTGLWEGAPDLDTARQGATATVLKNGKILICGGIAGGAAVGTTLLFDPSTRAYTPTGSLAVPRHAHQATRLKDGNVLVTGGFSAGTGQLASAELYNWMTGAWSLLPASMSSRRQDHTATLTNSGNVLLVGGFGGTQPTAVVLDTIEVFILTTSIFQGLIHRMQSPRRGHTATMQENGVILVAGGSDGSDPLQSAELYDPNHPPFAPAPNMTAPRALHTATLLPGVGVLLIGGEGQWNSSGSAHVAQASAEIYSGTFFQSAGSMASGRAGHVAVDLGRNQVLVCGGENASGPLASAELYGTGSYGFQPAGNMTAARARPAAAATGDGDVLVCGGTSAAGSSGGEVASSELFDPLFRLSKNNLPEARERCTVTRIALDDAYVIGGRNLSGPPQSLSSVLKYAGWTDEFTLKGTLATPRYDHTATLLDAPARILVVGGSNATNQQLASAEMFDLTAAAVVPVGQPTGGRTEHTATLLPDGRVLIAGGAAGGLPVNSAELYDPATNAFSPTGNLTYGRFGHSATLLPNGTVLMAGGMSTDSAVPGGTGITFTTEIYDPATGAFTLQPQPNRMQVNRAFHSTTLLTNGKVLFAGGLSVSVQPTAKSELYDPASNAFVLSGSMLGPRYRHTATATAMPNGQVMVVGGLSSFSGQKVRAVELYDPTLGTFSRTGDSWHARANHAAVLTWKKQLLVIGGSVDGIAESAEFSKPTDCTVQMAPPPSPCFIATAAFGSELHPQVQRLRAYRDQVLLASAPGRLFVRAYYRCSPPVARLVERSSALRAIVRFMLR